MPICHPASGRSAGHPVPLCPGIPLRFGHPARTGGKFAAARLIQSNFPESGHSLIFLDRAGVSPDQGEYVRRLGDSPLGEWANEPTGCQLGVDHRGSTESDTKPIDRR